MAFRGFRGSPKAERKEFLVRIDLDLVQPLQHLADDLSWSANEYINHCVRKVLKMYNPDPATWAHKPGSCYLCKMDRDVPNWRKGDYAVPIAERAAQKARQKEAVLREFSDKEE